MTIDLSGLITPADKLREAKERKRSEITAACQAAIDGGFFFDGHHYDSDQRSQTNIIGTCNAVAAGVPLPEGFIWRTADNQDVPMDVAGIIALGAALLAHINAQYAKSWQLKAMADQAESMGDLSDITWQTHAE
ncbi:DUF4376 domain-containing protein [Paracandidimonas soli]|uniref:Uncharacterized protein DUF4376 n=1 Tax=Paracandidimonas soli TaxID=1917182 RepID=A0A4R3ULE1_9BURK|nr:DUF4376 domain-containing protein [Paracandidimonas soli]TCU91280.1 uncharacterized protein DUF4376 [Paracandidimonas soli]